MMTSPKHHAPSDGPLDRVTYWGMYGAFLAILAWNSYGTYELARWSGVPWYFAWVPPVSLDLVIALMIRVWLDPTIPNNKPTGRIRRRAGQLAAMCCLLNVAANGLHLAVVPGSGPASTPLDVADGAKFTILLAVGAMPTAVWGGLAVIIGRLSVWKETSQARPQQPAVAAPRPAPAPASRPEPKPVPGPLEVLPGGSKQQRGREFVLAAVSRGVRAEDLPTARLVDEHVGGQGTGKKVLQELRKEGLIPPYGTTGEWRPDPEKLAALSPTG